MARPKIKDIGREVKFLGRTIKLLEDPIFDFSIESTVEVYRATGIDGKRRCIVTWQWDAFDVPDLDLVQDIEYLDE